jgi:hypothetical protein
MEIILGHQAKDLLKKIEGNIEIKEEKNVGGIFTDNVEKCYIVYHYSNIGELKFDITSTQSIQESFKFLTNK